MTRPENLPVFLKGIHIQGFKSFADSVNIELGHGLSVVVGPNGSGKSNIADAVRWVLGEQSAKSLRGSKMEDIIFSGSTQRRPVGMAEVSLIFDNTTGIFPLDFQEVTITRRAYRDGDGQYLINKAVCRLKDIQELFMDTGAGKEGFSIIGQGRVEEILTLKAEERRSLIEEAAGITKFRSRKNEAIKRLDATTLNLQRIEDIVREIEGQLIPLAAQAQVAEQSISLSKKQRNLEIQTVVLDISVVKEKLNQARLEAENDQKSVLKARTALEVKEVQALKLKDELHRIDNQIQQKQEETFEAEQALNGLVHEQNLRHERFKYLNEQLERLTAETQTDIDTINSLTGKVQTLTDKKIILKRTVEESANNVNVGEQQLAEVRENTLAKDIEGIKRDLFQALNEQTNCSNELTGIQHTLASLNQQILSLEQECEPKEAERESLVNLAQEQDRKLTQLVSEIQISKNEELKLRSQWDELRRYHQETVKELQNDRSRRDQSKARLHALKALEGSLEGYQRGVRMVMTAAKKGVNECRGLCGTVADLIRVEEKYETALEIALGAGMQNVIAEDEQAAKRAIGYLKAHQLGRVTFLPLDVIKGSKMSVNRNIETDKGYIGVAVDLADFTERYRPAMEFLLGRIVVVTDMEAATRIARLSGYRMRIVTLDGDQVHPGGSLSGGSIQRKGGNLLSRSREIKKLQIEVDKLEKNLAEKERESLEQEQAQKRLGETLERLNLKLRDEQALHVKLKARQENIQNQIERLSEDLHSLGLRQQKLTEEKDEQGVRLEDLTKQMKALETISVKLREEFNVRESEAKAVAERIDAYVETLTREKIKLAKWEQELAQCEDFLEQENLRVQEKQISLAEKTEQKGNVQEAYKRVEKELKELGEQLKEQSQVQKSRQYDLMESRKIREELLAGSLKSEEELQKGRQEVHALEQRLHGNELRIVRWETECQTGLARLSEEFSLTWEEGLTYQTDETRGALGKKVQEIKKQIEALGPINHEAIEDYPKILKRQEFMLNQQKDLIEANRTLHQLISELDKTMSERFSESFNAVNTAFQEIFKELFNGGHAELHLVEPERILETGVEIIAQPPGKKPQLLSLLSGGERALTAIAILFALLKVKPSPFCILDEIEASLDDANVQRFAQYIHRLSDTTQFIVVSHRKGTMEAADILYGITMEECGVSKLLSVKLDDRGKNTESA